MKLQENIFDEGRSNNTKEVATHISKHSKKIMHYDQIGFISEVQECFKLHRPVDAIKTKKDKNCMLI